MQQNVCFEIIVPLFQDLMSESINDEISPHDCIPFQKIRKLTKSGVVHIAAIFTGKSKTHFGPCGSCIDLGSNASIVVQITTSLLLVVMDYFRSQGVSHEKAKRKIESKATWYDIVDGVYRHVADGERSVLGKRFVICKYL